MLCYSLKKHEIGSWTKQFKKKIQTKQTFNKNNFSNGNKIIVQTVNKKLYRSYTESKYVVLSFFFAVPFVQHFNRLRKF